MKNACLESIFIPEKYVFGVCFESPFTRMISSLKYKWPPGDGVNINPDKNSVKYQVDVRDFSSSQGLVIEDLCNPPW